MGEGEALGMGVNVSVGCCVKGLTDNDGLADSEARTRVSKLGCIDKEGVAVTVGAD